MALSEYKKLYRILNEARKDCKVKVKGHMTNAQVLYKLQQEKDEITERLLELNRKKHSFSAKLRRNNIDDDIKVDELRLEQCISKIEEYTNTNYVYYKDIHNDILVMSTAVKKLVEKHPFLDGQILAYKGKEQFSKHAKTYIARVFPTYFESIHSCEAILLYLKDFIIRNSPQKVPS